MPAAQKKKPDAYDQYIDWKIFSIPVLLFFAILAMPTPHGMKKVATEVNLGPPRVIQFLTEALFDKASMDGEQWQLLTARIMEQNLQMGALSKVRFLDRDVKWCGSYQISADQKNLELAKGFVKNKMSDPGFEALMQKALDLRKKHLTYESLSGKDKDTADHGAWGIKVAVGMAVFVLLCFLTECIPLPGVAFCLGLILVFTGVVHQRDVAALYWDDAVWFIMGSLMFAAAFVKTGVDKRVCLILFKRLAVPDIRWITLLFFVIISPLAAFISEHALAAMFLPIGMLLYENSLTEENPEDPELGKMLMITIAMACNIGGPGAPSGGARNIIMMTYLSDMFGIDIGYFQWMTYCFPFVLIMLPVTWLMITWRFRPKIKSLAPSMVHLKNEIDKMGGWDRKQIMALVIFFIMVFGWFTEKSFYEMGIYPIRLGIGVIAVAGAVAYLLTGIVNWRDYQQKVDWGVVWLYAGAIIFGKTLDQTGAAYWLARSVLDLLAPLGMNSGIALLGVCNGITGVITNLMANGPTAATVGPIMLNIAGVAHSGTTYLPFMAMSTAIASSFAYCLIIATPANAIVYASGYLKPRDFLRIGLPLWFFANILMLILTAVYWALRGFPNLNAF